MTSEGCPEHMTAPFGATNVAQCICDVGYYMDHSFICRACPVGTECLQTNSSLEDLKLLPRYWRWRSDVADVRPCDNCIGGTDDYCRPGE